MSSGARSDRAAASATHSSSKFFLEIVGAPVRDVRLDMRPGEDEIALRSRLERPCRHFRREAVVVEQLVHLVGGDAPLAPQRAEGQRGSAAVVHQMGGRKLLAQGVVDEIADGRAIAGPGEAVRQAPVLQCVGGRPATLLDILQHFNGRADPVRQGAFSR
jgi:hypothetical protein